MQSFFYHTKRPSLGLVQQTPALINFLIQRAIHCVRLPLHWSQNIQKAKLSSANHQAELARSLRSYVQRFNAESLRVDIPDEKFAITAFIVGLGVQSKDLVFSISKNPQASMTEVLSKAEKYINGEEALISKKGSSSTHKEKSRTDKRRGRSPKRQSDRERSPKKDGERSLKRHGNLRDRLGPPQPERRQRYSPRRFTPLTASVSQVLREVRNEQFLRWPTQMKSDPTIRDNTRYYELHTDYGHRTDDCIQLKREIEYLIRRG